MLFYEHSCNKYAVESVHADVFQMMFTVDFQCKTFGNYSTIVLLDLWIWSLSLRANFCARVESFHLAKGWFESNLHQICLDISVLLLHRHVLKCFLYFEALPSVLIRKLQDLFSRFCMNEFKCWLAYAPDHVLMWLITTVLRCQR